MNSAAQVAAIEHDAVAGSFTMTPLTELRAGDEAPGASVNARKTHTGIDDLLPSIRDFGVLVPLVVTTIDGAIYVVEGNRRLEALYEIYQTEQQRAGVMVPTVELGRGADPLEVSMMLNSQRRDLHPVDQFEVFSVLIGAGGTIEQISERYLLKPAQVRQALRLAALAPEVREAWRAGHLDSETAEAFAATRDQDVQRAVLRRAKEPTAWRIRQELQVDQGEIDKLLKFVSARSYVAAGHEVNELLFAPEGESKAIVSDPAALKVMADDKMAAQCLSLTSEGWGWAITSKEAPADIYAWKRIFPGVTGDFDATAKASAGCVLRIGYDGKLAAECGYIRPGDKVRLPRSAEQKAADRKKREERAGSPSPAVLGILVRQLEDAVADVLTEHPALALPVIIAALACRESPLDFQVQEGRDNDFERYLTLAASKPGKDQLRLLAHWVGECLSLDIDTPSRGMINLLPGNSLTAALKHHFDARVYFTAMPADTARAALAEMGVTTKLVVGKEALIKLAADNVKKKGWLPEPLRFAQPKKRKGRR